MIAALNDSSLAEHYAPLIALKDHSVVSLSCRWTQEIALLSAYSTFSKPVLNIV